jgi:uncharacterized cupin superfamily protein
MPNVFEPEFEPEEDYPDGFGGRYQQVGKAAGATHLGASLYEVDPGQALCPYHWHAANEEMLIVLAGKPILRTPEGERELAEGELVSFARGEEGAHTVYNRGEAPVRVLVVSEMNEPEVAVYPDSGKVLARQQAPGSPATGLRKLFRISDEVDYWEGELEPDGGRGGDD